MAEEIIFRPELVKERLGHRTKKWLADGSGVKQRRIYDILSGEQEPTASELFAIAEALGVKPGEFMATATAA